MQLWYIGFAVGDIGDARETRRLERVALVFDQNVYLCVRLKDDIPIIICELLSGKSYGPKN